MDSNAWLAGATSVYALGTLLLAWVTSRSSTHASKTTQDVTTKQISASAESTTKQIEASSKLATLQLTAAADGIEKQMAAAKEAARIEGHTAAVSQSRQGWINQLRDEVTGFLTEAGMRRIVDHDLSFSDDIAAEGFGIVRSMKSHLNKVRLLLNPTEGESTELVEMLTKVYERSEGGEEYENKIVAHTQAILKKEWERVKIGE